MPDRNRYRRGVGLMLLNDQRQVFVARRIDVGEAWQMPQGGIDSGEDARHAALRELEEEIGTAKAEIIAESREWLSYDLPADLRARLWGGRYRGQMQKWFVLRFLGSDADINIKTKHPEFTDWRWADNWDLPRLIVDFKRDVYIQVLKEFAGLLPQKPAA